MRRHCTLSSPFSSSHLARRSSLFALSAVVTTVALPAISTAYAQPVTQEDVNQPAATPPEIVQPDRLEVPVGPESPEVGEQPATPPLETPETPAVTSDVTPTVPTPRPTAPLILGDVAVSEGREISEVRIVGNRVVPAETILAQIRAQRGAAFSRRATELDIARIDGIGFFATVQAQVARDVTDPNRVVVTYIVTENRVVTAIDFEGNTAIDDADLLKVIQSQIGVVLNRNTVDQDVAAIQKAYRDKGFAILVRRARQEEDGTLRFTIAEATVSEIRIEGLKKTRESLVRDLIRTEPGAVFDGTAIRRDLNRIYDTGFFEDVSFRVDDDPENPGQVIVTIVVRERRTGQFSVGLGFDSRSQLSGFVTLSDTNFRGSGRRALVSIETGSRRNYEVSYGDPFIGKKNASYDVSLYSRTIFREPNRLGGAIEIPNDVTFEEDRVGGRINYSRPLDFDRQRVLLFGYRNERADFTLRNRDDIELPVEGLPENSTGTVSAFSVGFLRDKRDLRIDTSRGSRESLVVEQALSFLGGDFSFTKVNLDLRRYVPLQRGQNPGDPAKLVLAGRVVLGRSINQLPAFEQYFIGGSDTVRGYESDFQFGDNQYYGNLELRYRFQSRIQAVLFADVGTAFGGRFASDDSANLLTSIGVGARLQTPIGPIRFDVARGEDGVRTHFAIGPTF